jgi:ubiquinol-cytochrome c reductase cytochrome c subunit
MTWSFLPRRLPVSPRRLPVSPRRRFLASVGVAAVLGSAVLLVPSVRASGQASPFPAASGSAQAPADPGRSLYLEDCAWCHGNAGEGTDRGPALQGVGAASADFMLSTGRMPIPQPEDNPARRPPAYDRGEIDALVGYVASLGAGIPIPSVDPSLGNLRDGARLYQIDCAACHSSTGIGGALTQGLEAPSVLDATPVQIAEAMRLGGAGAVSGNMPRFGPDQLDDQDVDSIVAYIRFLQHRSERTDRGGLSLGRWGPVAEGFVAWAVGLLALLFVIRWIGERG